MVVVVVVVVVLLVVLVVVLVGVGIGMGVGSDSQQLQHSGGCCCCRVVMQLGYCFDVLTGDDNSYITSRSLGDANAVGAVASGVLDAAKLQLLCMPCLLRACLCNS